MEMVQADRKPTAETLGHNEIGCLLKLKNPIYLPEAGLARLLKMDDHSSRLGDHGRYVAKESHAEFNQEHVFRCHRYRMCNRRFRDV